MKKIQLSLAFAAIVLASGAAFASNHKPAKQNDVLWGQKQNGTWVQTTLSAHCTAASQVCKENFPAGQDPNDDPSGGTIVTNNGFIN
jgi:hypothetical protein